MGHWEADPPNPAGRGSSSGREVSVSPNCKEESVLVKSGRILPAVERIFSP